MTPLEADSDASTGGELDVRRLLEQSAWRGARVVAGCRGLDRPVRFLNVMTVPDIERWTKPYELLITTGYPLPRRLPEFCDLIERLARRGVSALAIKFNEYVPDLPTAVVALADEVGLPLVSIPAETPIDDLLSASFSLLVAPSAASLAEAHEIHDALLKVVLSGGGLGALVHELSGLLDGAAVAVVDGAGRVRATAGALVSLPEAWRSGWGEDVPEVGRHAVSALAPVRAGNIDHGWMVVSGSDGALSPRAAVAVEHGAVIAALEMTRDMAVLTVERQFAYETLRELLTAPSGEPGEAATRALRFGWDLDRPMVVLVGDLRTACPLDAPVHALRADRAPAPTADLSPGRALDLWAGALCAVDPRAATAGSSLELLAVVDAGTGSEETAQKVCDVIADRHGWRLVVGLSRPATAISGLPRAYQEARTAVRVASKLSPGGPVTSYARLGLYRLLSEIDRRELESFVEETLGPVLRLPSGTRDELLGTLRVVLEERLNVAEAARRLHYHYNTLRYRIAKLEQLLGNFAADPDAWVSLEVALQIARFLDVVEPVSGTTGAAHRAPSDN